MTKIVVRAESRRSCLWRPDGEPLAPAELGLSERLLVAVADWASFYDEVQGDLGDTETMHEFVSQGYKIAYGIRREIKGSEVWLARPDTGELVAIELRSPR